MKHRRSSSRKNNAKRNTNIELFKIIDPVLQSVLFIVFLFNFGSDMGISYVAMLMIICGYQLISLLVNLFFKTETTLKNERAAFFISLILYFAAFFYINRNVKEKFIEVIAGEGLNQLPLFEIILLGAGFIIAFWYFSICFREIRVQLDKAYNED